MAAGRAKDRTVIAFGGPDVVQSTGRFSGQNKVNLNFPDHRENIEQGLVHYYQTHTGEHRLEQFSSSEEFFEHAKVPNFEREMLAAVEQENELAVALAPGVLEVGQHHAEIMAEKTTCFCYSSIGRAIADVDYYRSLVGPSVMYKGEYFALNDLVRLLFEHTRVGHIEGLGRVGDYIDGDFRNDFPGYDTTGLGFFRDNRSRLRVLITQPFDVEYGDVQVHFGGQIILDRSHINLDENSWVMRLHAAVTELGFEHDVRHTLSVDGESGLWKSFIEKLTPREFKAAEDYTLKHLSSATTVVQLMNDRGVRLVRGHEGFFYYCEKKKCIMTMYTDQKTMFTKGMVNFIF